jgi:hypothetical protein
MGRITSNTATTLNIVHNITGLALENAISGGQAYTIGLVDRGLILPQTLLVSSDNVAVVELIMSTVTSPITLAGASFVALNTLGSFQSFAERDVSSTALSGGEVVMAFTAPVGGSGLQQLDLTNLFPLYNTVRGNQPDFLTVAVTTTSGITANIGAHIICQEAMS